MVAERLQEAARRRFEEPLKDRKGANRLPDPDQIARRRPLLHDAGNDPLQVENAGERVANRAHFGAALDDFGDRVLANPDEVALGQRVRHPLGQQTAPHRRNATIHRRKERTFAAPVAVSADDFKTSARRFVDFEPFSATVRDERVDMVERLFLRFEQIIDNAPRRLQRANVVFFVKTEPFERRKSEVLRKRVERRPLGENPAGPSRQRRLFERPFGKDVTKFFLDKAFGRSHPRQLVEKTRKRNRRRRKMPRRRFDPSEPDKFRRRNIGSADFAEFAGRVRTAVRRRAPLLVLLGAVERSQKLF